MKNNLNKIGVLQLSPTYGNLPVVNNSRYKSHIILSNSHSIFGHFSNTTNHHSTSLTTIIQQDVMLSSYKHTSSFHSLSLTLGYRIYPLMISFTYELEHNEIVTIIIGNTSLISLHKNKLLALEPLPYETRQQHSLRT